MLLCFEVDLGVGDTCVASHWKRGAIGDRRARVFAALRVLRKNTSLLDQYGT